MTITEARKTLTQLGYDLLGYQAMGRERRYCVWRGQLAEFCNLPTGGSFDKDGLKAFAAEVVASISSH